MILLSCWPMVKKEGECLRSLETATGADHNQGRIVANADQGRLSNLAASSLRNLVLVKGSQLISIQRNLPAASISAAA